MLLFSRFFATKTMRAASMPVRRAGLVTLCEMHATLGSYALGSPHPAGLRQDTNAALKRVDAAVGA